MSTEDFTERVKEIEEAGERLLGAIAEEKRCAELACVSPGDDHAFNRWARARQTVEELQTEYSQVLAACARQVEQSATTVGRILRDELGLNRS